MGGEKWVVSREKAEIHRLPTFHHLPLTSPPFASHDWEMPGDSDLLPIYLHLARAAALRGRPFVRDKLLLLAAVAAYDGGLKPIAEACRDEILGHNPHHMVSHWPTFITALQADDFFTFLSQVRRQYPPEKAEQLLQALNVDPARERETYFHDGEYAAALLGKSWEELLATFGED